MKKTTTVLALALAGATLFAFSSCGEKDKDKFVKVEANADTVYAEYAAKMETALDNVLYLQDSGKLSMNISAKVDSEELSVKADGTMTGNYAWTKAENAYTLNQMSFLSDTNMTMSGESAATRMQEAIYLNDNGLYLNSDEDKTFFAKTSETFEFMLSLYASDYTDPAASMSVLTENFGSSYAEISANGGFAMYTYSDDSGSAIRMEYAMSSAETENSEEFGELLEMLQMLGADASIDAKIVMSVYFNKDGGFDHADVDLSANVAASDTSADQNVSGSFRYQYSAAVKSASTVSFPADLDSYTPFDDTEDPEDPDVANNPDETTNVVGF